MVGDPRNAPWTPFNRCKLLNVRFFFEAFPKEISKNTEAPQKSTEFEQDPVSVACLFLASPSWIKRFEAEAKQFLQYTHSAYTNVLCAE